MPNVADELRAAGVHAIISPGDAGYADAIAGFDTGTVPAPDVVVDAQTAQDVASTVAILAERRETLTILGSGHGRLTGPRGGVAVTLRSLTSVDVDPAARTVRIGAGCTWDPVLAACDAYGLAAPCGSAPGVGVAGYLLGGGLGPIQGSIGFSSDHVTSIEVVTPADGLITVSVESHPDLFWAMRGGKGGFGVVVAVTVQVQPLSTLYGGSAYFATPDVADVLAAYAQWAPHLPESSTTSIALIRLPSAPALPDAIRGKHVASVRFASLAAPQTARTLLAPIRAAAPVLLDTIDVLPYSKIGTIHGDPTHPMPVANGSAPLSALGADAVASLLAAEDLAGDKPLSSVEIRTLGPAARRAPTSGDAVGGREAAHLLNVYAAPDPALSDGARLDAVRAVLTAVDAWRAPVNLVNFVGRANDAEAVVHSWTPDQNDRLDAIRTAHDPEVMFPFARHAALG